LNASPVPCLFDTSGYSYVFLTSDLANQSALWAEWCDQVVQVPVLEFNLNKLYNLTLEFGQALKQGFHLGWNPTSNCTECENNKGQCGYILSNDTSTYTFHCFCPNNSCPGMFYLYPISFSHIFLFLRFAREN
jgi:Wall-associated receptor kinase C-terminal